MEILMRGSRQQMLAMERWQIAWYPYRDENINRLPEHGGPLAIPGGNYRYK